MEHEAREWSNKLSNVDESLHFAPESAIKVLRDVVPLHLVNNKTRIVIGAIKKIGRPSTEFIQTCSRSPGCQKLKFNGM